MRFGYITPNSWGFDSPRQVVDLVVQAEEAGLDSVWVSHHVLHAGFVKERLGTLPYHDSLVMLGAFATATTKVRLGTSVLVLPYLNPITLAKTLATIDHLSAGRVDVGVGVGAIPDELNAVGNVVMQHRGRYSDETLEVMQLLWSPGPSSFAGRHFQFEGIEAYPGPYAAGGLPILVGGNSDAAIRRAVRFGMGWQGIGVDPERVRTMRTQLHDALAEAGRSTDDARVQVRLHQSAEELADPSWLETVNAYEEAGATELLIGPLSTDPDAHRAWLDAFVAQHQ